MLQSFEKNNLIFYKWLKCALKHSNLILAKQWTEYNYFSSKYSRGLNYVSPVSSHYIAQSCTKLQQKSNRTNHPNKVYSYKESFTQLTNIVTLFVKKKKTHFFLWFLQRENYHTVTTILF